MKLHHEFVSILSRCLQPMADVKVTVKLPRSIVDYDLIHIIGAWVYTSARLAAKAKHQDIPTIFSPIGDLQPWIIRSKQRTKSAQIAIYQRTMVEHVSAVHLCNPMEKETFRHLGWNNKTQVIRNPLLTNELSEESMAQQMLMLYQKVLDSNCYAMIGEQTEDAICFLLQIGVDEMAARNNQLRREASDCLSKLSNEDWRRVFIYANDEGILDRIRLGLARLQYATPNISLANIDRFPTSLSIPEGHLDSKNVLTGSLLTRNRFDDFTEEDGEIERLICTMILNLKYEIDHRSVSMLHLIDLFELIRFENYDEENLTRMLRHLRMQKFASRLLFVMKDILGLTEGFMPLEATDDKATDRLRKAITKLK